MNKKVRYINADELEGKLKSLRPAQLKTEAGAYFSAGLESALDLLRDMPPADVKEVHCAVWQQRTSAWLKLRGFKCSKCDFETLDEEAYKWLWCPNCGCFMGWLD